MTGKLQTPREIADEIARSPGFWPNYSTSKLARAVERPLADPNWQAGILSAYSQTKFDPTLGRTALSTRGTT